MDFFEHSGGVYWLLVLGAIGGAAVVEWATRQWRRTAEEGADVPASCGLSGGAVAKQLLTTAGIGDVAVVRAAKLDRYDARHREVQLRHDTFDGVSLVSLAVAAHEVGHAQQFAEGFWPARWRGLFWPVCYALTAFAVGLLVLSLGVIPAAHAGVAIAAVCFISLLLQLPVVLPLEYDAWRRAKALARDAGLLAPAEEAGFERILTAAARTYVAAEVRRWIMLLIVVAATVWILPQVSVEPVPAEAPNVAVAENVEPWLDDATMDELDDALVLWLPSLADLVAPALGLFVLLWFVQQGSKRGRSSRERAVERNNAALALYQQGAVEAAIVKYTEAIGIDPAVPAPYHNRATCYVHFNRLDEALADFNKTLELRPGFVEALAGRGHVWMQRGDYERALADFNEALARAPRNAVSLACRGNLRLAQKDYERALADFEAALVASPQEALAYQGRGMVWLALENFDRALADFTQALAFGGSNPALQAMRGNLWLAKRDYDRAIADFAAALAQQPAQPGALRDRGLAYYLKGDLNRAFVDLDEALRLDANDAVSFNNRGAAHLRAGHFAAAVADLNEALRLNPAFANPHKHLAWLRATCPAGEFRNGAQAVTHATRALELSGGKPAEWFGVLAAAHAEAGDFHGAVDWQTRCRDGLGPEEKAEPERRLALYQAGRPLRDETA